MKRLLALILVIATLPFLLGLKKDVKLEGSGTENDPYLISTANELRKMAELVNSDDTRKAYSPAHYMLTADIDLGGKKWTPIGGKLGFEGVLDGNGHTVSGMKIDYSDPLFGDHQSYFGLVAELNKGVLRNLTVSESKINVKSKLSVTAAALVGHVFHGTVENCHVTDSVTVTSSYQSGGVAGSLNTEFPIRDCSNAAAVSSTGQVGSAGGIASHASCQILSCSNSGTVSSEGEAGGIAASAGASVMDCSNSGTVKARGYAAGIAANFSDGALNHNENNITVTISRCVNTGSISSEEEPAGGIAASARTGSIVDCTNEGDISSPDEVGGILGYFQISPFGAPCEEFIIRGCSNSGAVLAKTDVGNSPAGGIIGMIYPCSGTSYLIENCSNSGTVESEGQKDVFDIVGEVGGIIGHADVLNELLFVKCSNSGAIRGVTYSGGIAGYISARASEEAEPCVMFEACSNSGTIHVKYHGGLTTMCYCGGLVGFFDGEKGEFDAEFIGCSSTGALSSDIEPFASDELCAGRSEAE